MEAREQAKLERAERKAAKKAARLALKQQQQSQDVEQTLETTAQAAPVDAVEPPSPMDLLGQDQPDPAATGSVAAGVQWVSYADHPLFADAGPTADDVEQGGIGDCYYLSVLTSVAKTDATVIRESVVDLGDGTYWVQFRKGGNNVFVRVDAELARLGDINYLPYAKLGAQESMWVAIMEKAYAFFRTGAGTYQSIEAGWMTEAYTALGLNGNSTFEAQRREPAAPDQQ